MTKYTIEKIEAAAGKAFAKMHPDNDGSDDLKKYLRAELERSEWKPEKGQVVFGKYANQYFTVWDTKGPTESNARPLTLDEHGPALKIAIEALTTCISWDVGGNITEYMQSALDQIKQRIGP